MLIAVASQNFRTITPHAGKTRRFMIFDAQPGQTPQEIDRLELAKDESIHEFNEAAAHPLDAVNVVIAGSAGQGFVDRMASRGVKAVSTAEADPVRAIEQFLAGSLLPPGPDTEEGGCNCSCHGTH
jgi:predicted Fe-Mo cluster-binding NifX family protein